MRGEERRLMFNRKVKLIAATLFAGLMLTGIFAGQAQAQSVRFRVSGERHVVAMRPVNVSQVERDRRQRVYTNRYPRYNQHQYWRYQRYHHRHHTGVRVRIG